MLCHLTLRDWSTLFYTTAERIKLSVRLISTRQTPPMFPINKTAASRVESSISCPAVVRSDFLDVGEMDCPLAKNLIVFVTLAGDQHYVPRPGFG